MKRFFPRPRATVRQITRTSADHWRPPAPEAAAPVSSPFSTSQFRASPAPSAGPATAQAIPRGGYYDVLLTSPPPYSSAKAAAPPVIPPSHDEAPQQKASEAPVAAGAASKPPIPVAGSFVPSEAPAAVAARRAAEKAAAKDEAAARARIVFGSRLAGPMERENRLAELRKRSRRIAGVLVPPKPTEPDNCCMSGCVNCVWDRFGEDMEQWAAASAEASRRLQAQEGGVAAGQRAEAPSPSSSTGTPAADVAVSMDDDGGGSETNWSFEEVAKSSGASRQGGKWEDELFKNVPVGIREFMKQEKRLKLKHMQEGTTGG